MRRRARRLARPCLCCPPGALLSPADGEATAEHGSSRAAMNRRLACGQSCSSRGALREVSTLIAERRSEVEQVERAVLSEQLSELYAHSFKKVEQEM